MNGTPWADSRNGSAASRAESAVGAGNVVGGETPHLPSAGPGARVSRGAAEADDEFATFVAERNASAHARDGAVAGLGALDADGSADDVEEDLDEQAETAVAAGFTSSPASDARIGGKRTRRSGAAVRASQASSRRPVRKSPPPPMAIASLHAPNAPSVAADAMSPDMDGSATMASDRGHWGGADGTTVPDEDFDFDDVRNISDDDVPARDASFRNEQDPSGAVRPSQQVLVHGTDHDGNGVGDARQDGLSSASHASDVDDDGASQMAVLQGATGAVGANVVNEPGLMEFVSFAAPVRPSQRPARRDARKMELPEVHLSHHGRVQRGRRDRQRARRKRAARAFGRHSAALARDRSVRPTYRSPPGAQPPAAGAPWRVVDEATVAEEPPPLSVGRPAARALPEEVTSRRARMGVAAHSRRRSASAEVGPPEVSKGLAGARVPARSRATSTAVAPSRVARSGPATGGGALKTMQSHVDSVAVEPGATGEHAGGAVDNAAAPRRGRRRSLAMELREDLKVATMAPEDRGDEGARYREERRSKPPQERGMRLPMVRGRSSRKDMSVARRQRRMRKVGVASRTNVAAMRADVHRRLMTEAMRAGDGRVTTPKPGAVVPREEVPGEADIDTTAVLQAWWHSAPIIVDKANHRSVYNMPAAAPSSIATGDIRLPKVGGFSRFRGRAQAERQVAVRDESFEAADGANRVSGGDDAAKRRAATDDVERAAAAYARTQYAHRTGRDPEWE